ncbi:unnamed protein product [Kuraishia capsulata CBS 1993]|uniref:Mitochondrial carrier protein n=1 Tax=Kuraishia capsulata CBS 1993 TaxID=1382522 RepID=W6MLU4_9ASCO|nr:uncharacterized protein KUCA_T00003454001 [Kuraishia capsulata CBS 1993]CDK27476.1 unnamed protein product [Kuraishia capsulata CBS 1993]
MTESLSSSIPIGYDQGIPSPITLEDSKTANNNDTHTPLLYSFLAGGFGGAVGDSVMHSLDTVKTRQQAAPNIAKYKSMIPAYSTIFTQEGFRRGLYGGYTAAMLGSFPSAATFFITYESMKRLMIDRFGINDTVSFLTAGFLGDLASSIFYVPSEVLKTRLQLQGKYNNPHFNSGYNYHGLTDAIKTIVRQEGWQTLFFGYRATLVRDLPFSALQFAFYEKFRSWAYYLSPNETTDDNLSVTLELATGGAAGGLAGTLTTPLDVIKTRIQTQSTSSMGSSKPEHLSSPSIMRGLTLVYRANGFTALFAGVGPRFIWTSVQSSVMLFLYQLSLKNLEDTFGSKGSTMSA